MRLGRARPFPYSDEVQHLCSLLRDAFVPGGVNVQLAVGGARESGDSVWLVRITHRGRHATTLRGAAAANFLDDVERGDPQELLARLTGNYKRGNERAARNHPRNRGR